MATATIILPYGGEGFRLEGADTVIEAGGAQHERRTTLEIIEKFAGHYRLNRREATLSTVEFLKSLVKRGVISILIK